MDPITSFFASLFEWFGLNPLYGNDLGEYLRGFDITCSDYLDTHWYSIIGFTMIGSVIFLYFLQYHILDKFKFDRFYHWWFFAVILVVLNFMVAFTIPYNAIHSNNFCSSLILNNTDCFGFGFSNAIWSFIFYTLITTFKYPKHLANNSRYTTFWKP